jgi:hypothetical protein
MGPGIGYFKIVSMNAVSLAVGRASRTKQLLFTVQYCAPIISQIEEEHCHLQTKYCSPTFPGSTPAA